VSEFEFLITLVMTKDQKGQDCWVAEASRNKSVDYDAVGVTPLNAVMALAEVLYREVSDVD
jgi:hypothetical protein